MTAERDWRQHDRVVVRSVGSWADGDTGTVVGFSGNYVTVERDAGAPRFMARPDQLERAHAR